MERKKPQRQFQKRRKRKNDEVLIPRKRSYGIRDLRHKKAYKELLERIIRRNIKIIDIVSSNKHIHNNCIYCEFFDSQYLMQVDTPNILQEEFLQSLLSAWTHAKKNNRQYKKYEINIHFFQDEEMKSRLLNRYKAGLELVKKNHIYVFGVGLTEEAFVFSKIYDDIVKNITDLGKEDEGDRGIEIEYSFDPSRILISNNECCVVNPVVTKKIFGGLGPQDKQRAYIAAKRALLNKEGAYNFNSLLLKCIKSKPSIKYEALLDSGILEDIVRKITYDMKCELDKQGEIKVDVEVICETKEDKPDDNIVYAQPSDIPRYKAGRIIMSEKNKEIIFRKAGIIEYDNDGKCLPALRTIKNSRKYRDKLIQAKKGGQRTTHRRASSVAACKKKGKRKMAKASRQRK